MAVTSTVKINNQYYYFNDNCAMHTGWLNINNGNDWKYYGSSGSEYRSKWLNKSGKYYYFSSSGYMLSNQEETIEGETYYFNKDGVMS